MTYQAPTLFLVGAAQGLVLGSGTNVKYEDSVLCPGASREKQLTGCE